MTFIFKRYIEYTKNSIFSFLVSIGVQEAQRLDHRTLFVRHIGYWTVVFQQYKVVYKKLLSHIKYNELLANSFGTQAIIERQ